MQAVLLWCLYVLNLAKNTTYVAASAVRVYKSQQCPEVS